MNRGRKIHQRALDLQEKGDFDLALAEEMKALTTYQKDNDLQGYSEIHAMVYLTLNHLHEKTGWLGYLVTAKNMAKAGVELAEKSDNKGNIAVPLFNLAKVEDKLGEKEALDHYKKAIEVLGLSSRHNRESVKADWENHLAICEYKLGDEGAIQRAEEAIKRLSQKTDASDYEKGVWMSGGYMRMAEVMLDLDKQKASGYLEEAKKIINGNDQLKIRKEQWEKLRTKILK
jgi:tetratricopeptide (TPR) repeat protein